MQLGIKYGLSCSHFSGFNLTDADSYSQLESQEGKFLADELYCDVCGQMRRVNRINIFLKDDLPVKDIV